jgi:hypothetical protein
LATIEITRVLPMKTLSVLTVGVMLAIGAATATAADDPNVLTITVTVKRPHAPTVERVAPRTPVETAIVLPTDMPEAEIDYHLAPIAATPSK